MKFKILLLIILLIPNVSADDSEGDFERDLENDPVEIQSYFDIDTIVSISLSVEVYLNAYDVDNSSTELIANVTYSLDGGDFITVGMEMTEETWFRKYYFEFTFIAPNTGQYVQFFYNITDGYTTLRSPVTEGTYYDIQWGVVSESAPGEADNKIAIHDAPIVGTTDPESPAISGLIIVFAIMMGITLILIMDRLTNRKIISKPVKKLFNKKLTRLRKKRSFKMSTSRKQ